MPYDRLYILCIAYIMDRFMPDMPAMVDIYEYIKGLDMNDSFPMADNILRMPSNDLKSICSCMHKKYKKQLDNEMYLKFIEEAGAFIDKHKALRC